MSHPDIDEAIVIIKTSAVVKSHPRSSDLIGLIDSYAKAGTINYDKALGGKLYGSSQDKIYGTWIKVNEGFTGDPATTAYVILHEAMHRVQRDHQTVTGEIKCRELDAAFGSELLAGLSYTPPAAPGTVATASLATSQLINEINKIITAQAANKVVEAILALDIYKGNLTAGWVAANYRGYGGLANRDPAILALYLRKLSDDHYGTYATEIIDILDSMQMATWQKARADIPDLSQLRWALRKACDAPVAGQRIAILERRLNEKFH